MPSTTIGEASNEYVDLPECRPTEPHWNTHAGVSLLDVVLVDLVERAVALPVVGAVVGEPVLRLRAGVEDALVGDALGHRRRAADDVAQADELSTACPAST